MNLNLRQQIKTWCSKFIYTLIQSGLDLEMSSRSRPLGITLLAVLHVIQAVALFLGGIGLIALGAFIRRGFGFPRFLDEVAFLIGVVVVVLGLIYLGLAWGMWTGKGWAWFLSLILAALGLIGSLISLVGGGLVTLGILILDVAILYYLFRPNVRTFFGEQKAPSQP